MKTFGKDFWRMQLRKFFKRSIIAISVILIFTFWSLFTIYIYESYDNESYIQIETPSYEQGLWDGFNGSLKYFNEKDYLKDTSINIEILELKTFLEKKQKEREFEQLK
jgi:hypothetical protein